MRGLERRTSADLPFGTWARDAFPNTSVDVPPAEERSRFLEVVTSGCRLIRMQVCGGSIVLSGACATANGLGDFAKLVWQLSGRSRVVDRSSERVLAAGGVALMPLRHSYVLDMTPDYEALLLIFDFGGRPLWRNLAEGTAMRTVDHGSAAAAARACASSLIENADGKSGDAIALEACLALMGHALVGHTQPQPVASGHSLRMAAWMVEQHLGDKDYGPEDLARGLGRSRRSLYQDFAEKGITPAAFIRDLRLRRAREAILAEDAGWGSLTQIALRCGFGDSASFSHAFRKAFGVSPSGLLKAKLSL